MNYNFDKIISREATDCEKFDARDEVFGRADVIPMWVADMILQCPRPLPKRSSAGPGIRFTDIPFVRTVISGR